jgi:hypothetical protein
MYLSDNEYGFCTTFSPDARSGEAIFQPTAALLQ